MKPEGIISAIFMLIVISLLLKDSKATSTLITAFAEAGGGVIGILQTRNVSGLGSVNVSG